MKRVDGFRIDERREVGESLTVILASGCARPTQESLVALQWTGSLETILLDLQ
jgi:hypothetical protein